jgi:hypothetical protein
MMNNNNAEYGPIIPVMEPAVDYGLVVDDEIGAAGFFHVDPDGNIVLDFPIAEEIEPFNGETMRDLRAAHDPRVDIPFMHADQGGDPSACIVVGCNSLTSHVCGICINCHPLHETPNFPCSIH